MPMLLIKGAFVPESGQPDGDTCRFRPDNPSLLHKLDQTSKPLRFNQENGTSPLRFEAIDALEKNANPGFSGPATEKNLELLGVRPGTPNPRGYIIARQLEKNGRPVAFVFAGPAGEADGAEVFLDVTRLRASVNWGLIAAGTVYPMFYDTLFFDLRDAIRAEVKARRASGTGLWSADATGSGVTWSGRSSLASLPPIFPKLWRRLENYTNHREYRDQSASLDQFDEFLRFENDDRLTKIANAQRTGFDNVLEIDGNRITMTELPEDVVFES